MSESMDKMIEEFSEQYYGKIFYFCLKKTGNRTEAEDLASDVALDVIAALRKGIIPERFSAYVWKAARSRYCKWARSRYRESFSGEDLDCIGSDDVSVENAYIMKEDVNALRREMSLISKEYREILVSFYIEDKKISQISKEFSLPEGTVKTKLFQSRKILMEGMKMAREFGVKSYKPENVNLCKSGRDGTDGSPWKQVEKRLAKNILLEAYYNPSTIEELSLELGVAAPYMEDEVAALEEVELLTKIAGNKYETNFMIISADAQKAFVNKHRAIKDEYCKLAREIVDIIGEEAAKNGGKLFGGHQTFEELKWFLLCKVNDEVSFKVDFLKTPREKRGYTPRPFGGKWDMVGYEDTGGSDGINDDMTVCHDVGHEKIHFGVYSYHYKGFDERQRFYSQGQAETVYKIATGDTDNLNADIIKSLLANGLTKEENGRYIPQLVILDLPEYEKNAMEQAVSEDVYKTKILPLYNKMLGMQTELYEFVEERIKKDVPKRLFDRAWMLTEANVYMRGYLIMDCINTGYLKMPEPEEMLTSALGVYLFKGEFKRRVY